MAEYIGRNAALSAFTELAATMGAEDERTEETIKACIRVFQSIPAEDVAPVVHGQWEWYEEQDGYDSYMGWRCSHCKTDAPDDYDEPDIHPQLKYCPNCGAKMEEAR